MDAVPGTVNLYSAESIMELDRLAIASGTPGYSLMRRAGSALLDCITSNYPSVQSLLIICGAGNNAGDGYVLARLAKQDGIRVTVCSLIDVSDLKADALQAFQHWQQVGDTVDYRSALLQSHDLVVDAMLGTGLSRDVAGLYRQCIEQLNRSALPVIAVDIPSGLDADTGRIQGAAIVATHTVSFIGLKQGLFTGSGKQCCGHIELDTLSIDDELLAQVQPSASLIDQSIMRFLPARRNDSHKGDFGHVLVAGGNTGMPGAVALTARAALKAGSGRVSVVTRPEHVNAIIAVCPEVMVFATATGEIDIALTQGVTHAVIGPGLGTDAWSERLLYQVKQLDMPVLYDADALNLLASSKQMPSNTCMITPHPGEAGRLLDVPTSEIQADRFKAVRSLTAYCDAAVVLKGSGSLIADAEQLAVCVNGTAVMASAGMGDVLSGIAMALVAQGLPAFQAANFAVVWHARAAELCAHGVDRGVLASDVIDTLPDVLAEAMA